MKFDPSKKLYVKRICGVCMFKSQDMIGWCQIRALEWKPYGLQCPQEKKLKKNGEDKEVKQKVSEG